MSHLTHVVNFSVALLVCAAITLASSTGQANAQQTMLSKKSAWGNQDFRTEAFSFAAEYSGFLGTAKTELSTTETALQILSAAGFKEWKTGEPLRAGQKVFVVNRDRTLVAARIGTVPLVQGSALIGAHNDSPRIDLKARPVYESQGFALFQTIYYGGIKKYHWLNLPLALVGRVNMRNGSAVKIEIGFKPDDPVFVIPDAAPHVDNPLRNRTYTGVVEGEELDPIAGSIPSESGSVTAQVLASLRSQYGISEEDFVSAELSLVPALAVRDVGIDRSLVAGYGHDDHLSCYTGLRALIDMADPTVTAMVYLVDNEETGSINNTGAQSNFLTSVYGLFCQAQSPNTFSDNDTRRALRKANVVSADVNDGVSPLFPGLSESGNAAKLGHGVAIKRYGRSFDANAEFTAKVRSILDTNAIPWQTASYKVEGGGGGTIGGFMSREGMEVIDIGVPILSMHSTYELASKADIYNLYRFFKAFLSAPWTAGGN